MRKLPILATVLAAGLLLAQSPARAQSVSPQQIQGLIASGQAQSALAQLQPVLRAHPESGVAWYLTAEAQDAVGNEAAARTALTNAEHYSPNLTFARADAVAALQAHLNGPRPVGTHIGVSHSLVGIIGLVILFLLVRMLLRRRRYPANYPTGYGPGSTPPYPYGPGPAGPGGFGGGLGGGLGGSLLGGLAAGAGFAAGERVIDGMLGGSNSQPSGNVPQDPNFGNGGGADRDDGLQGNPGWDSGSNGGNDNFDSGNNW